MMSKSPPSNFKRSWADTSPPFRDIKVAPEPSEAVVIAVVRFSALTKLIDETDTAIIGNDTKLTLVKEFIPTIGSSLTYNVNFSNAIVHPHSGHIGALSSTKFTIVDGENILRTNCALDDLDGVIRVFRLVNNKKTIVNSSLGTIDYTTGKIILNSFNPTAFVGSTLQITVSPESYDIIPLREQIIQISSSLLTVNVNDISAIKSGQQTFTTGRSSSGNGY